VGEVGVKLDGDETVTTPALVIERTEQMQGRFDVGDHELPVGGLGARPGPEENPELVVVVSRPGDRALEDRGVGRDTADSSVDQFLEATRGEVAAPEIVEPGALAR
jgi:hypothetical protein